MCPPVRKSEWVPRDHGWLERDAVDRPDEGACKSDDLTYPANASLSIVPSMRLYHDPSSRSVRPFITLKELDLPCDIVHVSLRAGEHQSDAHRARHPLCQLPVLEDGELTLFESVAICQYLADKKPGLVPPLSSPERGLYYQWCAFVSGSLEPAMSRTYAEKQGLGFVPGTPALADVLDALDRVVAEQEYLLSFGFSTADILVGATIAFFTNFGVRLPSALDAYLKRLLERPSFQQGLTG